MENIKVLVTDDKELHARGIRKVAGFDKYYVSSGGEMFAKKSYGLRRMKCSPSTVGYPKVIIRRNKKKHTFHVHRLVAAAFIENPERLPVVNHLDGDKLNCSVDNLEWASIGDNQRHAYRTGLMTRRGSANSQAVIDENTAKSIKLALVSDSSPTRVAKNHGVTTSIVKNIKQGIAWGHISVESRTGGCRG